MHSKMASGTFLIAPRSPIDSHSRARVGHASGIAASDCATSEPLRSQYAQRRCVTQFLRSPYTRGFASTLFGGSSLSTRRRC